MISMKRTVQDGDQSYEVVMVVCPGCLAMDAGSGLHMLPIGGAQGKPNWTFNGNLDKPGFEPSILTKYSTPDGDRICHSYLREGVWEFLGDCTHSLANQKVPAPDLPDWVVK